MEEEEGGRGLVVGKVKRETMVACMTCSLCDKLLRDATTISECLHTFCRKCIYDKITEDEIECCPVCNINLGANPLDKLRPDHILQSLRAKIFPLERKRETAPEVVSPIALPRVSAQSGTTGKRTKSFTRKYVPRNGSSTKISVRKEEESRDETHKTITEDKMQSSSSYAGPNKSPSNPRNKNVDEPYDPKVDVANRKKPIKPCSSQGMDPKSYSLSPPVEYTDWVNAVAQVNKRLAEAEKEADGLRAENLALTKKVRDVEEVAASLRAENLELTEKVRDVEEIAASLRAENLELTEKVREAADLASEAESERVMEVASLKSSAREIKRRFRDVREKYQEKLDMAERAHYATAAYNATQLLLVQAIANVELIIHLEEGVISSISEKKKKLEDDVDRYLETLDGIKLVEHVDFWVTPSYWVSTDESPLSTTHNGVVDRPDPAPIGGILNQHGSMIPVMCGIEEDGLMTVDEKVGSVAK